MYLYVGIDSNNSVSKNIILSSVCKKKSSCPKKRLKFPDMKKHLNSIFKHNTLRFKNKNFEKIYNNKLRVEQSYQFRNSLIYILFYNSALLTQDLYHMDLDTVVVSLRGFLILESIIELVFIGRLQRYITHMGIFNYIIGMFVEFWRVVSIISL